MFWVSCPALSFKSLFLIFAFPDLKLLVVQHQCFSVKEDKLKTQMFGQEGVARKRFVFTSLCFAPCEKLSFFSGPVFGQFWSMFEKKLLIALRYFQHIFKPEKKKKKQKIYFEGLLSGPSRGYYLVQVGPFIKMARTG